jgi:hypothetical protein
MLMAPVSAILAAVRFSFILYSFDRHTSDNGGVLVRTDPPNTLSYPPARDG